MLPLAKSPNGKSGETSMGRVSRDIMSVEIEREINSSRYGDDGCTSPRG